jgi:2,5-furandicarboxylate decarboxylase 1
VHALHDGGRYLDSSIVLAKNPETGNLNTSIHRMMVTKKDRLTFLIDPGRHLGEYLAIAEKMNRPLDVTINNGVGIVPWITSVIPKQGDNKYEIANHIVGRPIDLIKAQKVDVPAYANAQFVIEAEIIPNRKEMEGPFAEVTGYYAARSRRWVMNVLAVTRQRKPIFHTLLSGQEVWNSVGLTAEAKIFYTLKKKIPQIRAVHLDHGGCGFYGAVVQVNKNAPNLGKKVILETFKAFDSLQKVIIVDMDVDLYNPVDVNWAITTRFDPERDIFILKNQIGHILNPMVKKNPEGNGGTVTKIGMDATAPFPKTKEFERVRFMEMSLEDYEITRKIV